MCVEVGFMFETAELGQKVSKKDYREAVPLLREKLLVAQGKLRDADFPVVTLFAGVDGAGKGESANLLSEWMDPRLLVTRAFGQPSEEEVERPDFWRYWRDLPPRGRLGIFLSAWYSKPILRHVFGETDDSGFDNELDRILNLERMLANDGALILKFWMHLGKDAQKKRFRTLEADPLTSWRVTKRDWKHWKLYDRFVSAAEHTIMRTSTGRAPWTIVEGADHRYRSLKVGNLLLEALERRLTQQENNSDNGADAPAPPSPPEEDADSRVTVLDPLDMSLALTKNRYKGKLEKLQARLNQLHRKARDKKLTTILVFEGWDAGGKGGAIRRITSALDARDYQVISIAAPNDEEQAHHYLWRFWRHLPRAGRVTVFDRSWYGRVLVERIEGFASDLDWRRSYAEINDFEQQLVEHGAVLLKFWLHISPEEQELRFKARQETPYKRWKLTDEDWRNREKWDSYEIAVHDMIERTSTKAAPWVLVEGNDKKYARIKVLKTLCEKLEERLG
jgi:polyphosphate:AMP phosphotransferase